MKLQSGDMVVDKRKMYVEKVYRSDMVVNIILLALTYRLYKAQKRRLIYFLPTLQSSGLEEERITN